VIIGPTWFVGPKSLSPFVQEEIRIGSHHKLQTIPVLVRNATIHQPGELPDDIRELALRHARMVRANDDFELICDGWPQRWALRRQPVRLVGDTWDCWVVCGAGLSRSCSWSRSRSVFRARRPRATLYGNLCMRMSSLMPALSSRQGLPAGIM